MTTYSPTELADHHQRAEAMRTEHGDDACVIVHGAGLLATLCADAIELRRLRTVLVGLPIDDWQPGDWETFTVEVNAARTALEVTP